MNTKYNANRRFPSNKTPYDNVPNRSNKGLLYIIFGVLAAAVILFVLFGRGSQNKPEPGGNPAQENEPQQINATAPEETREVVVKKTPEPEASEKPEATEEPASEWPKTGTVFMDDSCEFKTIKVRSEPKKLDDDSNVYQKRVKSGERVTVYEIKQGSYYTWYRIGEDKWIAGNGTTYYVVFDNN